MRVYLAAAMTNPTRDLVVISAIHDRVLALGHEVLTPQVAARDGIAADRHLGDRELAQRDLALLASSHALLAEVSAPSHGVGIEVLAATRQGLPTLLLHRRDAPVSRLLLGLDGTAASTYDDAAQACRAVTAFLSGLAAGGHAVPGGDPPHPGPAR
jgi:hypothetical protein